MIFLQFIALSLAVFAVCYIVVESALFSGYRDWVSHKYMRSDTRIWQFVHGVSTCPYCLAVWVSAVLTLGLDFKIFFGVVDFFNWFGSIMAITGCVYLLWGLWSTRTDDTN